MSDDSNEKATKFALSDSELVFRMVLRLATTCNSVQCMGGGGKSIFSVEQEL